MCWGGKGPEDGPYPRDPVVPDLRRYDWTLKTHIRVSNTSPYLRFGTTGSLKIYDSQIYGDCFGLLLALLAFLQVWDEIVSINVSK